MLESSIEHAVLPGCSWWLSVGWFGTSPRPVPGQQGCMSTTGTPPAASSRVPGLQTHCMCIRVLHACCSAYKQACCSAYKQARTFRNLVLGRFAEMMHTGTCFTNCQVLSEVCFPVLCHTWYHALQRCKESWPQRCGLAITASPLW